MGVLYNLLSRRKQTFECCFCGDHSTGTGRSDTASVIAGDHLDHGVVDVAAAQW
jgi:hypothetical protein